MCISSPGLNLDPGMNAHSLPSQVQVYGACLGDAASACLIMELVPSGNLAERIYNPHKRRMSYLEILQVLSGPASRES